MPGRRTVGGVPDERTADSPRATATGPEVWVTERFWPGCTLAEVAAACAALRRSCTSLTGGTTVDLLGATLFPDDEALVTRYAGPRSAVVAVHELAHVPYDRLSRALEM